MLIQGDKLTPSQRRQVLAAFVYRWTAENPTREQAWTIAVPNKREWPRIPLISDDEWLTRYSFHFGQSGQLCQGKWYAEPIMPPPPSPILGSAKAGKYMRQCLSEQ